MNGVATVKVLHHLIITLVLMSFAVCKAEPLRIGVAGLNHGHAAQLLKHWDSDTLNVVGVAESNRDVVMRYADKFGFPTNLVYDSLEEMIEAVKPVAVAGFNPVSEHLDVVPVCAPKGIHVIVEKPLAATLEQAREMEQLAKKHNIMLLTNYETSWYPTTHKALQLLKKEKGYGDVRNNPVVLDAQKVMIIDQPVVLDIKAVTGKSAAVGDEHTLCVIIRNLHLCQDGMGAVTNRRPPLHRGCVRIIGESLTVLIAWWFIDIKTLIGPIVQGQYLVLLRFFPPHIDHLF